LKFLSLSRFSSSLFFFSLSFFFFSQEWTGDYETDITALLPSLKADLADMGGFEREEPAFSLVSGNYVASSIETGMFSHVSLGGNGIAYIFSMPQPMIPRQPTVTMLWRFATM
jgi:hypothetical protein